MLARSAVETLGDRRMISRYAATIGSSVPIVDAARSIPSAWVVDRKFSPVALLSSGGGAGDIPLRTTVPLPFLIVRKMKFASSGTSGSVAVSAANAIPAGRKESKATARMNGIFFNFPLSPYMDFRRLLRIAFHRSTGRRGRGPAAAAASSAATARQDHPRHDRQHRQTREKHFLHRILHQWMAGSGLPLVRPYRHFSPETSFLIPGRKGSRRSRHD